MVSMVLFPSSYFDRNKVDEDLEAEYNAVLATGLFKVVLFDYDKWFNEDKLLLNEKYDDEIAAVHRGWMMKPEKYKAFYEKLLTKNIRLITTPDEYELMHVFPNAYNYFVNDTAKMLLYPLHGQIDVGELKKSFERFMIKDYVKSVKGSDFPKYFDAGVTQKEFNNWMELFYKYRGDLLTGGICVKEYLDLKKYDERTNEYRVFYINHTVATVSKNSAQPFYANKVPQELVEKYMNLASIYYTVDYAELEDGNWTVIEAGDGSVSGLSEFQDIEAYYRTLYCCLN